MSVLECCRPGCERIMSDYYVNHIGWICSECKDEFIKYMEDNDMINLTEGEITRELMAFMSTPKSGIPEGKTTSIYSFFNERDRNEI